MVSPDSQATACLPSGRNSTYRPVQISAAGSHIDGQLAQADRLTIVLARNWTRELKSESMLSFAIFSD
jgi:hypothetical protein